MAGTSLSPGSVSPGSAMRRPSSRSRRTVSRSSFSSFAGFSASSGNMKSKFCSGAGAATAKPAATPAAASATASWACLSCSGVTDAPWATRGMTNLPQGVHHPPLWPEVDRLSYRPNANNQNRGSECEQSYRSHARRSASAPLAPPAESSAIRIGTLAGSTLATAAVEAAVR